MQSTPSRWPPASPGILPTQLPATSPVTWLVMVFCSGAAGPQANLVWKNLLDGIRSDVIKNVALTVFQAMSDRSEEPSPSLFVSDVKTNHQFRRVINSTTEAVEPTMSLPCFPPDLSSALEVFVRWSIQRKERFMPGGIVSQHSVLVLWDRGLGDNCESSPSTRFHLPLASLHAAFARLAGAATLGPASLSTPPPSPSPSGGTAKAATSLGVGVVVHALSFAGSVQALATLEQARFARYAVVTPQRLAPTIDGVDVRELLAIISEAPDQSPRSMAHEIVGRTCAAGSGFLALDVSGSTWRALSRCWEQVVDTLGAAHFQAAAKNAPCYEDVPYAFRRSDLPYHYAPPLFGCAAFDAQVERAMAQRGIGNARTGAAPLSVSLIMDELQACAGLFRFAAATMCGVGVAGILAPSVDWGSAPAAQADTTAVPFSESVADAGVPLVSGVAPECVLPPSPVPAGRTPHSPKAMPQVPSEAQLRARVNAIMRGLFGRPPVEAVIRQLELQFPQLRGTRYFAEQQPLIYRMINEYIERRDQAQVVLAQAALAPSPGLGRR